MTRSLHSNDLNTTTTSTETNGLVLSTRTTPNIHLTYNNHNLSDFRIEEFINKQSTTDIHSSHIRDEKKYKQHSKLFLLISIISATLIILFEAYMFAVLNIHKHDIYDAKYIEISIYLALFIFAGVYQIIVSLIAIYSTNLLLLVFLMLFYGSMMIYTGVQYYEMSSKITMILKGDWSKISYGLNIATIGVIGLTLVLQSFVVYFGLKRYVSWFTFKKIGADFKLKRIYKVFQIHRSVLLLDFFFFVGFTVQFLIIMVNKKDSQEFILTIIVLPLTIITLLISDISTTREWYYGTILVVCIFTCGIIFVLFKLIRMYTKNTSAYGLALTTGGYFLGKNSLLIFGIITSILLVTTIILEIWVTFNYNKGLLNFVNSNYKYIPGYKSKQQEEINIDDECKDSID
ncbi:unnamed protein product [Candida verbasci]|uniref:Uncharacterized protein n=1 Tax=Candida verbasci TaxID=1227364 RepID=A0A9W4XEE8_9ASCO|nr:unnamed protein product [Candida verbasci]